MPLCRLALNPKPLFALSSTRCFLAGLVPLSWVLNALEVAEHCKLRTKQIKACFSVSGVGEVPESRIRAIGTPTGGASPGMQHWASGLTLVPKLVAPLVVGKAASWGFPLVSSLPGHLVQPSEPAAASDPDSAQGPFSGTLVPVAPSAQQSSVSASVQTYIGADNTCSGAILGECAVMLGKENKVLMAAKWSLPLS